MRAYGGCGRRASSSGKTLRATQQTEVRRVAKHRLACRRPPEASLAERVSGQQGDWAWAAEARH